MFTTEDALTEMLLLEDGMGRPLYTDEAALARKLRVAKIVTIPEMEGRKGAKGGDLAAVIVNLADYTVGADKGEMCIRDSAYIAWKQNRDAFE